MLYLTKNGIRFGEDGISKTCSCHRRRKNYYVTENERCMDLLNKYRYQNMKQISAYAYNKRF